MEIKINKDVKKYEQKYILGLNARELGWTIALVVIEVLLWIKLHDSTAGRTRVIAMALVGIPFAVFGFLKYHGMSAEKWIMTIIKNEIMMPEYLVCKTDTFYMQQRKNKCRKEKKSGFIFWKKENAGRKAGSKDTVKSTRRHTDKKNVGRRNM